MHTTLIDAHTLNRHHQDPDWRVIDARFSLADAGQGAREYGEATCPAPCTPTWTTICPVLSCVE